MKSRHGGKRRDFIPPYESGGSEMSPKARLLIAIGNWLAAIGFAAAIWIVPLFTTLHARMAFTELDRAGVINANALSSFHPSRGFGTAATMQYRTAIPDFICASAQGAFAELCNVAMICCGLNGVAWSVAWWKVRKPSLEAAEHFLPPLARIEA